jgi:XisI protein
MDTLAEVVKKVVFSYAVEGFNARTFALSNEEEKIYAVNVVDTGVHLRPAGVVVIARVEGDKVIIEDDLTDRPLVDALVRAGIPREQIVFADEMETQAE